MVATSLFSILIHQNTSSTTVLCIFNTFEERPKALLKISLIDVDSAYYQRTIFFHPWNYASFAKCAAWNTEKLVAVYSYNFREPYSGRPQSVPKTNPSD